VRARACVRVRVRASVCACPCRGEGGPTGWVRGAPGLVGGRGGGGVATLVQGRGWGGHEGEGQRGRGLRPPEAAGVGCGRASPPGRRLFTYPAAHPLHDPGLFLPPCTSFFPSLLPPSCTWEVDRLTGEGGGRGGQAHRPGPGRPPPPTAWARAGSWRPSPRGGAGWEGKGPVPGRPCFESRREGGGRGVPGRACSGEGTLTPRATPPLP
jgi:hypothetical protein